MSTATIEVVVTKVCRVCGVTKVLEGFAKAKTRRDGRAGTCKACMAERMRAHYAANRDSVAEKHREYREANRAKVLEKGREYRAANREEVLEQKRAYREANREAIAEKDRAYYEANREAVAAKQREHRASNPHAHWAGHYRERARAYGLEPIVEEFTRADVVARYGDHCTYCETGAFEHLDHFVPVSAGGPHTLENARPSCGACNRAKGEMSGDEFVALQAELDEMSDADLEDAIDTEIARWSS